MGNQILIQYPSITTDYLLITEEKVYLYKKNLADKTLTKWSNLTLPMMGQADMCPLCCDTLRRIHHLSSTVAQIFNLNKETIRQIQISGHL